MSLKFEDEVLAIVNRIAKENEKIVVEAYSSDLDLRNDFNLDSLDLAELTVHLEEQFGVDVFSDGLIATIGEITEKVKQKV